MPSVGQELLNTPFPDMVQKLALAIAEAQTVLDENSTRVAGFMASTMVPLPTINDPTTTQDFSLISLGFFPGYYQFQEAIIEVKMAITMATSSEFKIGATAKVGYGPFSASVNASYSRKYEYKAEGSSLLRVKLAPAPPPAILQNYMDTLVDVQSKKLEAERQKGEVVPPPPNAPSLNVAPRELMSGDGGGSSGGGSGAQSGGRSPQARSAAPAQRPMPSPPPGYDWPQQGGYPQGGYSQGYPPPGWHPGYPPPGYPPPGFGGAYPPPGYPPQGSPPQGKQGGPSQAPDAEGYDGGAYRPSR